MAASMLKFHSKFARLTFQENRIFLKLLRYGSSYTQYIVLPELPQDTPETNAILRFRENPEFSEIDPINTVLGCVKLSVEHEAALDKHFENINDSPKSQDFESVIHPLEEITLPLNYGRGVAHLLANVQRSIFGAAEERISRQCSEAIVSRWNSDVLYTALKKLKSENHELTEFQKRLLDVYLQNGAKYGMDLSAEARKPYYENLTRLQINEIDFGKRVLLCEILFDEKLDYSIVSKLPRSLALLFADSKSNPGRGPWTMKLTGETYLPFMEHCPDRMLRFKVWNYVNNRCSVMFARQHIDNRKAIEDIRRERGRQAVSLGYENFALMNLDKTMAGSLENVVNMIDSMRSVVRPIIDEEVATLTAFAKSQGSLPEILQMWDVDYWRQKHKEHLYHVDPSDVEIYFPLDTVLERLFALCHSLFGITIKVGSSKVSVWDKDVSVYEVYKEGDDTPVACCYFDPYARPGSGKCSMPATISGRDRCDIVGVTPISFITMALEPPFLASQQCLMSLEQTATLFREFGRGLQQMLTVVPYMDITGQRNMEIDAQYIVPSFMETLLLHPSTLRKISCHHETNEPMSSEMIDRVLKSHRHMKSIDISRSLYLSAYDLELHISRDHWVDIMERVWAEYIPVPFHDADSHTCSLTSVFSLEYASTSFSKLWSQMVAADVFSAFEEVGLEDGEKITAVGRRFHDTYLCLGAGLPASEVFRRFRGRDPSNNAILDYFSDS